MNTGTYELIKLLREYDRDGWVVVALPPEMAEVVVGQPATQVRAMELSARIKAMKQELEMYRAEG